MDFKNIPTVNGTAIQPGYPALAGLTAGNVLRATGAGTVAFGALQAGDVPSLDASKIGSGTLASARGGTGVSNAGTLTNASNTTITGGGTLALAGFTLTVPASGTAALLATSNVFSVAQGIRSAPGGAVAALYVPWISGDTLTTLLVGASTLGNNQNAIVGQSDSASGVLGQALGTGQGVYGTSAGGGTGVLAQNLSSGIALDVSSGSTTQAAQRTTHALTATNVLTTIQLLRMRTSGTPAAGFGMALTMQLQSSTTQDQDAARISAAWSDATHATRSAYIAFATVNAAGALTERARITAPGALWLGKTSGGLTGAGDLDAAGNASIGGNLTLATVASRILGDFGNGTASNRPSFQSNVTNGITVLQTLPNGTSQISGVAAYNGADPNNSARLELIAQSTNASINVGASGTGTLVPLAFLINGAEYMRLTTAGNFGLGTTAATTLLHLHSTSVATTMRLSSFAPGMEFQDNAVVASRTMAAFIGMGTAAGHYGNAAGDLNLGTFSLASGNSNKINFMIASGNAGGYAKAASISASGIAVPRTNGANYSLDVAGQGTQITLALNATVAIFGGNVFGGLLIIQEIGNSGVMTLVIVGGGQVAMIANPSTAYSVVQGSANRINIYAVSSAVTIENKLYTSAQFSIIALRTHSNQ